MSVSLYRRMFWACCCIWSFLFPLQVEPALADASGLGTAIGRTIETVGQNRGFTAAAIGATEGAMATVVMNRVAATAMWGTLVAGVEATSVGAGAIASAPVVLSLGLAAGTYGAVNWYYSSPTTISLSNPATAPTPGVALTDTQEQADLTTYPSLKSRNSGGYICQANAPGACALSIQRDTAGSPISVSCGAMNSQLTSACIVYMPYTWDGNTSHQIVCTNGTKYGPFNVTSGAQANGQACYATIYVNGSNVDKTSALCGYVSWYSSDTNCSTTSKPKAIVQSVNQPPTYTLPDSSGSSTTPLVNATVAQDPTAVMDPATTADVINQLWQQAAQEPGYSGMPYSPVYPGQVQGIQGADPDINVLTQPVAGSASPTNATPQLCQSNCNNVSNTTCSNNSSPQGGSVQTCSTAASTTNPTGTAATTAPTVPTDWYSEPATTPPDPESNYTMPNILAPFTNLFPSLSSWTPPAHTGTCPTVNFSAFGQTYTENSHCTLFESIRSQLALGLNVLFAVMAVLIVLGA